MIVNEPHEVYPSCDKLDKLRHSNRYSTYPQREYVH
jgi:hypothetical protein